MTEQAELGNDIEERERLEEEEQQALDEAPVEAPSMTALVESGPSRLLEMAIQQDLDIDKLERLMAMQERWNEQKAKEAFYDALAGFQKIVPVIEKSSRVSFGTTKYSFAPLPDIKAGIQGSLSECGLSYRWEFADNAGQIDVTCIITHTSGHSEKTTMTAPADSSGSKNPVQERASTITYLQRYTLIGALGLTTANQDDDGRKGQVGETKPEDAAPNLPPLPEGTDTTAPKPETPGKTDFEKQTQLYGYLCEITGIDGTKVLSKEDRRKLSDELVALTEFESEGEIKSETSLRKLKGKWLNTALGKAKAKLGTAKDELLHLLDCPALSQELADEYRKEADDKRHKEQWYKDQVAIVNGLIADAEKPNIGREEYPH